MLHTDSKATISQLNENEIIVVLRVRYNCNISAKAFNTYFTLSQIENEFFVTGLPS